MGELILCPLSAIQSLYLPLLDARQQPPRSSGPPGVETDGESPQHSWGGSLLPRTHPAGSGSLGVCLEMEIPELRVPAGQAWPPSNPMTWTVSQKR